MANTAELQQELRRAADALDRGQLEDALSIVGPLLEQFPKEPKPLQLAGLIHKSLGDMDAAIAAFRGSLSMQKRQPEVLNSLANVLKTRQKNEEAEESYKEALRLNSGYQEAWRNLGLLMLELNRLAESVDALQKAIELKPDDISAITALANAQKSADNLPESIETYKRALALNPNYVNALHNLGIAYKLSENLDFALVCYQQALKLAPDIAEIDYSFGNALFEKGLYDEAEKHYLSAISKRPGYVEVHVTLNELYWQLDKKEDFGLSFRNAIATKPDSLELREAYIKSLGLAGRSDEALAELNNALEALGHEPRLLHRQARILANQGDLGSALESFDEALRLSATDEMRLDYAAMLIFAADYDAAMRQLDVVARNQPYQQLMWAYRGLCWRLTGDERYHWLNDYDAQVKSFVLETPEGYSNLERFLNDLKDQLELMHRTEIQPLEQTLLQGTQTPGRLLHKPVREIQFLKSALTLAVTAYIDSMPMDDTHPLYQRKTGRFRFSGSWSVKLGADGYHVNHVHPAGWISSSFYVVLPDSMSDPSREPDSGSIKFGESSLSLGDREVIAKTIKPEVGQLVLFPSYMWHGTFPFNGTPGEYRMTAPFDAIPD